MRALEAASALLLGIAATGTIVWYPLWRGRQRLARFTGRPAPIVTAHRAVRDLHDRGDAGGGAAGDSGRRPGGGRRPDRRCRAAARDRARLGRGGPADAAPQLLTPFARTCTTMYSHAHDEDSVSRSPEPAGTPAARCCACCSRHPEVEIGALTGGSNAGEPLGALQPHLVPLADRVLEETTRRDAGRPRRGLPGAAARPVRPRSPAQLGDDVVVIDCGADFRLTDAGGLGDGSTAATHAGSWPYGLPELPGQRDAARAAPRRIAVPGCYPTVSTLALAPAVAAGLVDAADVVVVAASGTSGAGKARQAAPARQRGDGQRLSAYGVGGTHRHTPEIVQNLSGAHRRRRCGSASRRCWCRCPAASWPPARRRCTTASTADDVRAAYEKAYADEPFVHLLPEGQWPQTKSVIGSNAVHLQVTVDEAAGRLVAVGAVDNLAKGTAGAAVQCMNLALGLARDHRPDHRGAGAVSDRRSRSAVPRDARRRPARPGRRGARRGPSPRRSSRSPPPPPRPSIVCAGRSVPKKVRQARAVHRVRRRGPARLRADRHPRRAARAAGRGGDQRLHASRPSTPTGSWSRSTRPTAAAEEWRRPGHDRRPRRPRRSPPPKKNPDERHPPRRLPGRRRRRRPQVQSAARTSPWSSTTARRTTPRRVFTANRCKANPVLWSQEVVKDGIVRAVVLNSGGANCYTGAEGFQTTHAVAEQVAERARHRRRSTWSSARPA